jgi:hypothetical protein
MAAKNKSVGRKRSKSAQRKRVPREEAEDANITHSNSNNSSNNNNNNNVEQTCLPLRWLSATYFFLLILVTYWSLLHSLKGREFMLKSEAFYRSTLMATPLSKRGMLWNVQMNLLETAIHYPLMRFGYKNNELHYLSELHLIGDVTPFKDGLALFKYSDVRDILNSYQSSSDDYGDALHIIPEHCTMKSDRSSNVKADIKSLLKKLKKTIPKKATNLNNGDDNQTEKKDYDSITRYTVQNIWYDLFGSVPTDTIVQHLSNYLHVGLSCLNGLSTDTVENSRDILYNDLISETVVGPLLMDGIRNNLKYDEETAKLEMYNVLDHLLLTKMIITKHLVHVTLERINSLPQSYVNQYNTKKIPFLMENFRMNAPFNFIEIHLDNNKEFDVFHGTIKGILHLLNLKKKSTGSNKRVLEKNSNIYLALGIANRDPGIFGGQASSKVVANTFSSDRDMSEYKNVLAPDDYAFNVETAISIIDHLLPKEEEDSTLKANQCDGDGSAIVATDETGASSTDDVSDSTNKEETESTCTGNITTATTISEMTEEDSMEVSTSILGLESSILNEQFGYFLSSICAIFLIFYIKYRFSSIKNANIWAVFSLLSSSGDAEYGIMSEQLATYLIGKLVNISPHPLTQ